MKIIIPPHKKISTVVKNLKEIRQDALDMIELIEKNDFKEGVWKQAYALSHSQVSENPKTFFVINKTDPQIKKNFRKKIIINPVILEKAEEVFNKEACMSMPYRKSAKVKRYRKIKVIYYVPGWFGRLKKKVETCVGLKAFIFSHEIEHFNGHY